MKAHKGFNKVNVMDILLFLKETLIFGSRELLQI